MAAAAGPPRVHLWFRDTEGLTNHDLEAERQILSAAEQERRARFVFDRDRREFTAAHALLRAALSRWEQCPPSEWVFTAGQNGKPSLADAHASTLEFNIAHTRGMVACALTRGFVVGVDVENVDRAVDGESVARNFFSPAEVSALATCSSEERPTRFIELWTLKEAFLKATGMGLSHPLGDFGFNFASAGRLGFNAPPGTDASVWHFALYAPSGRHRLAVAIHSPEPPAIEAMRWPDRGVSEDVRLLRATPGTE